MNQPKTGVSSSATIDVLRMAQDAARMQDYIARGGILEKTSGGKLIKPALRGK